ncbi:MAG: hypothetical protein AAFQ24_10320 [Pseudomonadota bacterium]
MEFKEAWSLWEQKKFEAARDAFKKLVYVVKDQNIRKRAWCGAAFMMVKLAQAERLERWLIEGHQIKAGSVWAYEAAIALFHKNDGQLATALRAAIPFDAVTMNPWVRGLSSLPLPDWADEDFEPTNFPELQTDLGAPPLTLLVSCDTNYFFRFADILGAAKGDWHIHFHVILTGTGTSLSEQRQLVQQRTKGLPNSHATVTIEEKRDASTAYMASRRYMLAPAALDRFRCPVLVCDIDLAIRGDLTSIPFDKPMLRYTDELTIPWQKMTANACLLTPNEPGVKLARLMAQYLEQQFQRRSGDIWWVDQNAMLFATRASGIDFNRWGPRFPQTFQAPTLHGDRDKDLRSK